MLSTMTVALGARARSKSGLSMPCLKEIGREMIATHIPALPAVPAVCPTCLKRQMPSL